MSLSKSSWKVKIEKEVEPEIKWNVWTVYVFQHDLSARIGNSNNALFLHISQSNHNFDFNSVKMLIYVHNKTLRRIFEAATISFFNSLNTRPDFYNISPYLTKSILNSYNTFHLLLIFSTYIIIFMLSIFFCFSFYFFFISFSFSSL